MPPTDYDSLSTSYWTERSAWVQELRRKIVERVEAAPGRTIPDDEDLIVGTGRRLELAVMFLDICGFSSRPAENAFEQDVLLRVLSLFFSEMVRIAEDYGGTVEKNTGDGLMAYFGSGGDPAASAAKRSVACALTMLASNDYLVRPILAASSVAPIQFRVGIDYGPVTIARLGAARRFNANVAIGTTANIACKLLNLAQPGEIIIGNSLRDKLPLDWQLLWTDRYEGASGWTYRLTGAPYSVFRYTGRWARLT